MAYGKSNGHVSDELEGMGPHEAFGLRPFRRCLVLPSFRYLHWSGGGRVQVWAIIHHT